MNPNLPSDLLQYLKTRALPKRLVRVGLALTSSFYSLRPDLLLAKSAPPAGTPARDWPIEGGLTPFTLPKFPPPSRSELFFIDAGVADPGAFWLAAPKGATVVCIPTGVDSWRFMAQEAARFEGLRAIHIVSHGQPGAVVLNGQHYAAADLDPLAIPLHQLGRALTKNGDIFLYGCEVGAGVAGQNLLNTLAAATGADIAASKNNTGNAAHGGNWDLEIVTGQINPALALNATSMAGYNAVLVYNTVTTTANRIAGPLRQARALAGVNTVPFSPAFPHALSITAPGSNVTNSAAFTVTFNQSVTGVDATDFTLVATGSVANGTISSITGSGAVYTVNVTGITGTGTLGLKLANLPSITATPSFAAQAAFSTGSGPYSVALGDVNGDGRLDIITANQGSATASVLLGNGNGTFGAKTDFSTASGPYGVALGDVNADGKLDIITSSYGPGQASVLLGNGNGTFQTKSDFDSSGAISVALGDVNGDGRLDLITASNSTHSAHVLLGNGNGTFQAKTNFATANNPRCVTLGDVNGDGKLDIITSSQNQHNVSVLLGNGNGTFQTKSDFATGNGVYGVTLGDVNGDGRLDIISANASSGSVSVLLGNGDGTFQTKTDFTTAGNTVKVTLGDVNGDGNLDIITADKDAGCASVLLGNGNGTFQTKTSFTTGVISVALGDVNGDGRLDIIAAGGSANVLLGTGGSAITATFSPPQNFSTGSQPWNVALGDANGDGILDIVTANFGAATASVLLGNGNGTFGAKTDFATGSRGYSVCVGDVNGDGKLDIITANLSSNTASVLLGNGNGTFQTKSDFATGSGPFGVTLGDVNSDGKLDIISTNFGSETCSVLLGNGNGTFGPKSDFACGGRPSFVTLGDVNGDGKPDIITANTSGYTAGVLLGNGNGTFGSNTSFSTGPNSRPFSVSLGDVNGDGKLDLISANFAGFASVLLGNGNGTFGAVTTFAAGSSPRSVSLGDMNGDGKLDIITANFNSNTASVLLGNGNGTFQTKVDFTTGSSPRCVALGDVNGDGRLDIITANYNSANASVLLNSIAFTGQTAAVAAAAPALTPTFGTPTATAGGFTVQISNYDANFTYGGTATASGTVSIDSSGLVTVSGVAAATSSTATVTTTRTGYVSGSAPVTATTLNAASTPTFGTPTATAAGFTVQISNYDANFTYGGTATASGTVSIDSSGLVTVSGVAANTSSTATVTTTRTGYVSGSAPVTATTLNAASTPTFGTPTATASGFTVQISNYDANFTYGGTATASGTVSIDSSGLVTVSGVAAATSSTATLTTTRTGYVSGSAPVTATTLNAASTPTFGTPTATASGFTVQISNYDANFTYGGTATASGTVSIDSSGLVTVSGVAADTSSTATVTTTRTGYVSGSAPVTAVSLAAPGAPTAVSAIAGNAQATVIFTAPANNGGAAITGYTVTSIPAGGTDTNAGSTSLSHVITGLTNGTAYTFTVTATNSVGTSSASTASSAVTPSTTPTVTTPTSASVGTSSADLGGNVTSTGGASLTAVGVVYAITTTNSNPQLNGTGVTNLAVSGTPATGVFTLSALSLTPGTAYSYAAYATNSQGTTYTSVGTFTTPVPTPALTFTTPSAVSIAVGATRTNAVTSALSGGSYGAISYTSSDTSKATVNATTGVVTGLAVGTTTITATQAAASGFNATASTSYTLTVTIGTPTITAAPTATGIAYGQTLASATLSGGTASVAGTFAFTTPSTAPGVGTAAQGVTFTPTDTTNYTSTTTTVNVTVVKAAPTISVAPTASGITYGQTLASSTLSGGTASTTGTFTFTSVSTAPNAGTAAQGVTFTPSNTANYNTATTTVNVTVAKATPTVTWATPNAITYGTTLSATQLNATGSLAGTITYSPASGTTPSVGTQTLTATFTPTDTTNFNSASAAVSLNVIVAVPGAPTSVAATTANGEATLTFTAPTFTGSSAITGYTIRATATDGSIVTVNATGSPAKVTGLTPGKSYRFAVTANNSAGSSDTSTTSDALTISLVNQTITFAALADRTSNSGSFALTASASSGLPVTFTVVSGPALLSGNVVDLTGATGTVIIRASQAGNATYAAALNSEVSFVVTAGATQAIFSKVESASSNTSEADLAVVLTVNSRDGTLLMVSSSTPSLNGAADFTVGSGGVFSASIASTTGTDYVDPLGRKVLGAPVTYKITGTLVDNVLTGTISPLGYTFKSKVTPPPAGSAAPVGFYKSTALAEGAGVTYSLVGPNNEVLVLAVSATATVGGLTTLKSDGTYSIAATTSAGSVTLSGGVNPTTTAATATLTLPGNIKVDFSGLSTTTKRTDRLINLSSRAKVGTGEAVLITGFVVGGPESKRVLVRAAGPALGAFGLASALPNPTIKIYQGSNLVAQNDDWNKDDAADITRLGAFAFALGSKDAALLTTLAPGAYTAQITDPSGTGTGVALAEIYDASINPNADYQRLVNISSRGRVTPDDGVLIGGFVVTGNSPKTLLIRGIGPALTNFGIAGALADPALTIYQDGKVVATNEGWANSAAITTAAIQTGAFTLPSGSKDAAVVITLNPGAYTAQIKSAKNASSGVALIEIYELP